MIRLKLYFTGLIFFISTLIFAQNQYGDQLIQRNGKIIVCQVREVGDDEIKYVMDGFRDDLVFGIDKNKVESILFSDGRELKFSDSMFGFENYEHQRRNALKFHFFSPLTGASAFSYERSLKPGSSLEAGLGIIGLGEQYENFKASGVYLAFGYKFIKNPDFYFKGMRYAHILKGSYFKPELAFSTYRYTNQTLLGGNIMGEPDKNVMVAAFILNIGKQWVFANRFLVDWYLGAGYGFGKNKESSHSNHYVFIGANDDTPLVMSSGFRVGILY